MGVCVTQFDPASFERGYICTPGTLSRIHAAVVTLNRIPYYKLPVTSKSKFHITIGHDTAMASLQLFSTSMSVLVPGQRGSSSLVLPLFCQ